MTKPHPVPREPRPLFPEEKNVLGDRPAPGYWIMGLRKPIFVWWRCPLCLGRVPIEPTNDLDAEGVAKNVSHHHGNEHGQPLCSWILPLRLLDYEEPS